jgi:FKBP-type peptidyl-prolyl cis-trans isomerase 2
MQLKQKDFIEIEFTGRIKGGEIFDSNIKEDLKKINQEVFSKPFVFCLGEGMFLKGIEDFLIGKEIGKYEIELEPEKAFGNRDTRLIQIVPIKIFREKQINPVPGIMFNFDGRPAKILTVSGGRVIVDFNNPLAGKTVIYKVNFLRKVDDKKEQINAFNDFVFRKEFKFEIQDKKLILEVEKQLARFVEMFKDKYKDLFELDLEIQQKEGPLPTIPGKKDMEIEESSNFKQ